MYQNEKSSHYTRLSIIMILYIIKTFLFQFNSYSFVIKAYMYKESDSLSVLKHRNAMNQPGVVAIWLYVVTAPVQIHNTLNSNNLFLTIFTFVI